MFHHVRPLITMVSTREGEKNTPCNCVFHSPGSHRVEGISFIFSDVISFPQDVFLSVIVESVFCIH